jgi:hypothetical protein
MHNIIELRNPNGFDIQKYNQEVPLIYGNATQWVQRKMLRIHDFTEKALMNQKPYLRMTTENEEKKRIAMLT